MPVDDLEIAGFGRLHPHFGQAPALRRTFFSLCERNEALSGALETAVQSVLLVDPDAVVRHANVRARTIFGRNDGLSLSRSGHLRLRDIDVERRLLSHLRAARAAGSAAVLRARRADGAIPDLLRLVSCGTSGDRFAALTTIYVFDPDADHALYDETLGAMLGVPRQAAALVVTLLQGGNLSAHAARADVTRNTVTVYPQAAFAATGTNRQTDLVRVVAGLLRDLGPEQQRRQNARGSRRERR